MNQASNFSCAVLIQWTLTKVCKSLEYGIHVTSCPNEVSHPNEWAGSPSLYKIQEGLSTHYAMVATLEQPTNKNLKADHLSCTWYSVFCTWPSRRTIHDANNPSQKHPEVWSRDNVELQLVADAGNNLMSRRKLLDVGKSLLTAGVNTTSQNNPQDEGLTVGEL